MRIRRPSPSLLTSLAVHIVLGVLVLQAVLGAPAWLKFNAPDGSRPVEQHIRYVTLKGKTNASREVAGREGGDGKPISSAPVVEAPPIVAPTTVPTTIAPPPATPAREQPSGGTGPLVGRGGPLRGIEPEYTDARVWPMPAPVTGVPLTPKERMDSVIADRIGASNDSVRLAHQAQGPDGSDWTVGEGNRKFGIDSKYIRLGPVSIPTAILGLLPFNNARMQGNVLANERLRQQNAWSREIASQAQRAMNEDEFRTAVRQLRQRRERERQEKKKDETRAEPVIAQP